MVSWTVLRIHEDQLILLPSPPSHHQVFSLLAQLQAVPPGHCVSLVIRQRGLLRKVEATLEPYATDLTVPDTWDMQSVARRLRRVIGYVVL